MKDIIVAGNWKMNTSQDEAVMLVREIIQNLRKGVNQGPLLLNCTVVVCPPFTAIHRVIHELQETPIAVGAQNCHHDNHGAFTGEVSAPMLQDLGCSYVILGHSERRRDAQESNSLIAKKAEAAIANALTPILCVGEHLHQREKGETNVVLASQIDEFVSASGKPTLAACVIAYEPVWAIGTGKAATPEQAQETHHSLRQHCLAKYGFSPVILYGGSVSENNAHDLFTQPDICGALVGGASLQAASFCSIINAANSIV